MPAFRRLLVLVLIAMAVAASCGGEDTPTGAADEPTSDDPASGDPASDEPLGAGPYPIADLSFAVDLGEGRIRSYRLACLGDTATFTGDVDLPADAACLALNEIEVRTRLLTDEHQDRICTEQYGGPEVATISGTLDGTVVAARIDRINGCGIDDFDRLLQALLVTT